MNTTCKELKRRSRENLNRRYTIPIMAYLIPNALVSLAEMPFTNMMSEYSTIFQTAILYLAEFLISILGCMLVFGEYKIHMNIARRKEFSLQQLFYCYRDDIQRYLLFSLVLTALSTASQLPYLIGMELVLADLSLNNLILFLVLSICSIILVVFVDIQFSLLYFVALDHPTMPLRDALVTTFGLMRGNRGRLFRIYLSFLGMCALALISFGIGWLWVRPYMVQTLTAFYLDIIGEVPQENPDTQSQAAYNQF